MKYLIIILIAIALLPKSGRPKKKHKETRPWYDVSYDDMITYDLLDDE